MAHKSSNADGISRNTIRSFRSAALSATVFTALTVGMGAAAQASTLDPLPSSAYGITTKGGASIATISDSGATGFAYSIRFPRGTSSTWYEVNLKAKDAWNLNGAASIVYDIKNIGEQDAVLGTSMTDLSGNGVAGNQNGLIPGVWVPNALALAPQATAANLGMNHIPDYPANTSMLPVYPFGAYAPQKSSTLKFYAQAKPYDQVFLIRNVRTMYLGDQKQRFKGLIDAFGQNTKVLVPDKVNSSMDLKADFAKVAAVKRSVSARSFSPSTYGGWSEASSQQATGSFRTQNVNGKWWLVDPQGKLFWSSGIAAVRRETCGWTMVTGRESLFAGLPDAKGPYGEFYVPVTGGKAPYVSGTAFDFYQANLYRKYGADWREQWKSEAMSRMKDWGFNTVGENSFFLPNTPAVTQAASPTNINTIPMVAQKVPDPYDSRFSTGLLANLVSIPSVYKNNPYLVGVLVDNEIRWTGQGVNAPYTLALNVMAQSYGISPAKQALVNKMAAKYGTVARLNSAWGTSYASWNAVNAAHTISTMTDALRNDASGFIKDYARKYFSTVAAQVKTAFPGKLYLGSRLHHTWTTLDVLKACAEHADVVSVNLYETNLERGIWANMDNLNKPFLVTEWHFGAGDKGLPGTGEIGAQTSAERLEMTRDYLESVIRHPSVVGAHWYRYIDAPASGEPMGGGDDCYGLVSITDRPYDDLIAVFKNFNANVYTRR